jgi:GntR family transcriptional regulator
MVRARCQNRLRAESSFGVGGARDDSMKTDFYGKYRLAEMKGLPKYAGLREIMRAAISDGFWKQGEQIPPEVEIARVTPYSLGTVQKALKALEEEGVLLRRQGHGTFVTDRRARMVDPWHLRFCTPEGTTLPVYPSVVSKRMTQRKTFWAKLLCPRGGSLIQIDRKINIGDEFLIYNRFFLSAERYPFFILKSNEELTSVNFKTILHRECNVSFTEMSYGMQVIKFPDSISRVLKLAKEAVGLMLEILASSERGPVYFQEIYVPQTSFKLCITDSATLPKSMS